MLCLDEGKVLDDDDDDDVLFPGHMIFSITSNFSTNTPASSSS